MIDYYEQLTQEEQEAITEVVQTLFRQTFLLERKYDKRTGRLQYGKEYRTAMKHLPFLKEYFRVAGITLYENNNIGMLYIQGETLWGKNFRDLQLSIYWY